jgi:hypothetical protein
VHPFGFSGPNHHYSALAKIVPKSRKVFSKQFDGFVKSPKTLFSVIPADAGIQSLQGLLDSRLRGSDGLGDFSRGHRFQHAMGLLQKGLKKVCKKLPFLALKSPADWKDFT